jgi:alkanesulfonate monooxygenase SsuD/methylene tetrahydromethanopterin reductase-like flavin-dependent oxidoreductase (luciferase family)
VTCPAHRPDRRRRHARQDRRAGAGAESDGFTSLWYASAVTGDPLVAMALAGRETTTIELGTAVLQT